MIKILNDRASIEVGMREKAVIASHSDTAFLNYSKRRTFEIWEKPFIFRKFPKKWFPLILLLEYS